MLKKSLIAIIAMTFCALLSISANASELKEACVKYQRADESWSNGYKVKAFILTGSELNDVTDSSHFDYYSHYLFIPWDNEGESRIMCTFFFNRVPPTKRLRFSFTS